MSWSRCPALPRVCDAAGARRERNSNKHKRLFVGGPGALQDGQLLYYKTAPDGVLLRSGIAVINPDGVSGIRCDCCQQVSTSGICGCVCGSRNEACASTRRRGWRAGMAHRLMCTTGALCRGTLWIHTQSIWLPAHTLQPALHGNGDRSPPVKALLRLLSPCLLPTQPICPSCLVCVMTCVVQVISCSQFEAHAGRGARRAPYDFIFNGEPLPCLAACCLERPRPTFCL